jgi:hypothetical protein
VHALGSSKRPRPPLGGKNASHGRPSTNRTCIHHAPDRTNARWVHSAIGSIVMPLATPPHSR